MKTAIDRAGRLVVLKALRDDGLLPGHELEIRVRDRTLVIEPLLTEVKLVRRGRRMVAYPRCGCRRSPRTRCARRWRERGGDLG